MTEEQSPLVDWMNLPPNAQETSLWAGLHDAQIVSIQSNLLDRTITLHLESDHLLEFHNLALDMQFLLRLDGVQSARLVHLAGWPGKFSVPAGVSPEEQSRLIADYQSKCREESLNWTDLENALTIECKQVLDIADAALAAAPDNSVALRINGLLNYTEYRELFLRAERLTLTRGDGQDLGIDGLQRMGKAYWDAIDQRKNGPPSSTPPTT
ncbi:MAG TPA: hypothetical protein VJO16_17515 [Candidatus Acidoferrum sp.]|nr:hypothetical protein [Candidatus Acidoferrum sp.]